MATDAQLCHISWIFPLLCVHTHRHTCTRTRKQCVLERFSSFCFFYLFFLPCGLLFFLSLLLWLSSLANDTRKLKLLFHLESVAKKIYGHPMSLSLSLSLFSAVVWFLCHFYAHYFAFAACLSLALCLLSIYNHNNKNNGNVPYYPCCCCTFVSLF